MKRQLFIAITITAFLLLGGRWTASAYNQKEFDRLLATNVCLNCDLYRAKLSKIDLTGAVLRGSNLISANLQKATLYRAEIDGVNFANANLEGAMWIDGRICQKGSIGHCVLKDE